MLKVLAIFVASRDESCICSTVISHINKAIYIQFYMFYSIALNIKTQFIQL